MIDRAEHVCHRMRAAQATNQSNRGWDFRDDQMPPIWFRAIAEVLRPRSLVILAITAGVLSLFWIS